MSKTATRPKPASKQDRLLLAHAVAKTWCDQSARFVKEGKHPARISNVEYAERMLELELQHSMWDSVFVGPRIHHQIAKMAHTEAKCMLRSYPEKYTELRTYWQKRTAGEKDGTFVLPKD